MYFCKKKIHMEEKFKDIIIKYSDYLNDKGMAGITLEEISGKIGVPLEEVMKYVSSEEQLVEKVLEFERNAFEEVFDVHDFEGVNAIDILMTVSRVMAEKFMDISPSITFNLKKHYPEIYQKHFDYRRDFIYMKIKVNLTKGINQGIYRDDLSIELIARLYLSRLYDLHNPEFFPPEKFSFEVLFDAMFDNFVRGIAKPEGLKYFEKKRKQIKFQ